jgi:hypothetical protein
MVKQSFLLDPNAQSYTDDEIVGKVNTATAQITRADAIEGAALGDCDMDDLADGTTNKGYTATEQTKLGTIEDNATADQSATEVRDLIVGLGDNDRQIVITEPSSGEYKVISVQRDSSGKMKVFYDDVAEP